MMKYSIELSGEAASDIDGMYHADRKLCERIIKKIEVLEHAPYEGNPLVGNHKGEFSLRVGDYRIVYAIDTQCHLIYILTIKHRKHVYK
jgi:mRNA interferase RelE/StbE